jgi:hypothetical protein
LQTFLGKPDGAQDRPMTTTTDAAPTTCWCCGTPRPSGDLVPLGAHPEVAVCLRCAHWLHQRARAREDERSPSPSARARGVLRAGRRAVVRRGWHRLPVIGPVLRRLGPRLP